MVILPVGGASASMVALDVTDGSEVWASGDDPASYAPALPITRSDRRLVVGYLENTLVIHDRVTGERLLRLELSLGYDEHSAWPIYQEPHLWLAAPFRAGSQLLDLPADFSDLGDDGPRTVWKDRIMSNDVVSSVLVDGHVYGFDIFDVQSKTQRPSRGKFRCIELLTGQEQWSQGTGKPRRGRDDDESEIGQAGIVVADGKLIVLNERGELLLLRATPERCDELARTSVLGGELTWTPPYPAPRTCLRAEPHAGSLRVCWGTGTVGCRPTAAECGGHPTDGVCRSCGGCARYRTRVCLRRSLEPLAQKMVSGVAGDSVGKRAAGLDRFTIGAARPAHHHSSLDLSRLRLLGRRSRNDAAQSNQPGLCVHLAGMPVRGLRAGCSSSAQTQIVARE
jgi:hypothetical protein